MPKFDNVSITKKANVYFDGKCRVKLPGDKDSRVYHAGDSFTVPANSSFDIDPLDTLDYVCHFG